MTQGTVLIVGAGHAGFQVAASLRQHGYGDRICLINDYGHLVLATGARNRLLDIPNANLANVRYLRILDESEALRKQIASGQRVVVIGAGFIGLEFAATARIKGLEVDVAELASRVMGRAVTAEI